MEKYGFDYKCDPGQPGVTTRFVYVDPLRPNKSGTRHRAPLYERLVIPKRAEASGRQSIGRQEFVPPWVDIPRGLSRAVVEILIGYMMSVAAGIDDRAGKSCQKRQAKRFSKANS
jgi:hypothetical protein